MKKIGLMGGTFDPIHNGHIAVALAARQQLSLNQVILLPAGIPPHKQSADAVSKEDRLEMTRLAAAEHPELSVSDYEINSGRVNYTVDTLRHFRQAVGKNELFFIIGADSFYDLPKWKDYQQIMSLTSLIVVSRPGIVTSELLSRFSGKETAPRLFFIRDISQKESSSQIRDMIYNRQDVSKYVPPPVMHYIKKHRLYGAY